MFINKIYKHSIIADDDDRRASTIRLNLTIKKLHKVMGQGSWPRGSGAKTSKKGGSGGGPKNRQILHTGGEIWGGVFLGGSRNKGS